VGVMEELPPIALQERYGGWVGLLRLMFLVILKAQCQTVRQISKVI
jgi:hypothetical protein